MDLMYHRASRNSYVDSLKLLEADIEHANALAGAIPCAKGGSRIQMTLVCNRFAPIVFFLLQWLDFSCSCLLPRCSNLFHILIYKVYKDGRINSLRYGRKATIREFYFTILPSLARLHSNLIDLNSIKRFTTDSSLMKIVEDKFALLNLEREAECGICLEPGTRVVLPNCCHAMCINCFRDWNSRSESCPFCRGALKRVNSEDLWILTSGEDVVDEETLCREDLLGFYMYINSLPKESPDALFLVYYECLI